MNIPKLRVVRPSDDLDRPVHFYCNGLGLSVLYRFEDNDGFDGVMIGAEQASYHLEFTRARGHTAGRAPPQDTSSSSTCRLRTSGGRPRIG